ncbi:hypothetical protein F4777DRAFT_582557 [Nemania sp. FL0916]|nr:hypothetical protein F4777DRAFT_582557 [Nemania sp. FL0916]
MAGPAVDISNQTSLSAAARELQNIISTFVRKVDFPAGLGLTNAQVADAILANVDAVAFDRHNQDEKIVEVQAFFTGQNATGQLFELLIIWDADNPLEGQKQTAHFGWEIRLNRARLFGPGHVFFKNGIVLPNYRIAALAQTEVTELKLRNERDIGNGSLNNVTHYFRLATP